jgi:hypothetical protein
MLRTSQLIVTGIAAAYASIVSAICPYPTAINVPNGTTATTDDMVNGQALVKQYMAEMETYLTCLENEEAELGRAPTTGEQNLRNQRHNAAVDAMETVAADFNDQVRTYKKLNR